MRAAGVARAPRLAPASFKRAATMTVYRWELRKLVSQKRTYLGFGLAIILPLIFVIVQSLRHHHDRGENIFASQITQSGLATPVLMLLFLSVFMLPLIASLVAGDIVATEDGNGTLKTILTRSVDRGQVFAAKGLAAATYATVAVFLSAAVATAAGVLLAPLIIITPEMGTIGIKGFIGAILGGFNNIPGAIAGCFLLGIIENLGGVYIASSMKDVISFVVLVLVLTVKPRGIFGAAEGKRA